MSDLSSAENNQLETPGFGNLLLSLGGLSSWCSGLGLLLGLGWLSSGWLGLGRGPEGLKYLLVVTSRKLM